MRFEYSVDERLPRLAWCAEVVHGFDVVVVLAGAWVEARPGWFVEGAWNGRFDDGPGGDATVIAGTGACVRDGGAVFTSATDLTTSLYVLRTGMTLRVSNSMAFALARAGDRLDPSHLYHAHDVLAFAREGPTGHTASGLPTENGDRLLIHTHGMVGVDRTLKIEPIEHPSPPAPDTLEDYVTLLQSGVDAVVGNALDAARMRPLRPLTTVSRGYDSPAVAVFARNAGCREAVTLRDERLPADTGFDDGCSIAETLGMRCTVYDAHAYERMADAEVEFHAGPQATSLPMAVLEPQLAQRLLLVGAPGDRLWSLGDRRIAGRLRVPQAGQAAPLSLREFRLRVGFVTFPVAYIGAVHADRIRTISESPALRAYRTDGPYARPFPRYIVETAGVPRCLFGQVKMRSAGRPARAACFSSAAERDFARFRRATLRRVPPRVLLGFVIRRGLLVAARLWNRATQMLPVRWRRRLKLTWPFGPVRTTRSAWSLYYYVAYLWSADRLQARYNVAARN